MCEKNEMLWKASCNFASDFSAPFKSDSPKFGEQSLAYALGSIINTMKAPALFSLVFGLLIIISPETIDLILFDGIDENLQNTGGAIALFSTAILYGLIMLSCKSLVRLCNFLRLILNATSYLGHLIASVTAGIGLGLIIPTLLELEVKAEIYTYIGIVFKLILMAVCYQRVSKSASQAFMLEFVKGVESRSVSGFGPVRYLNSFIYEQKDKLRLASGWILILSAVITMCFHDF